MSSYNYPWLDYDLARLPFIILDLETTGFAPPAARITEIAVIALGAEREDTFQTLINPQIPIPKEITDITGISNAMVRDQPVISEVLPVLDKIFENGIFVSHNVPFDSSFLDYAYRTNLGRPLEMPALCTLKLARKMLNLCSNKLSSVASHFGIEMKEMHRAMCDTVAVKDILRCFLSNLDKDGLKTGHDLLKRGIISNGLPRVKRSF